MKTALKAFEQELDAIREAGTWREERIITTPQYSRIDTTAKKGVVNLCANNYLGLSTHPALIEAAKESYDRWGFGLSSIPPASTPTAACSRRCSARRTPSFPTS